MGKFTLKFGEINFNNCEMEFSNINYNDINGSLGLALIIKAGGSNKLKQNKNV